MAIIRTTAFYPLILGYVGVFASLFDCNKIILPSKIQFSSSQSYPIVEALCNPIITAVVVHSTSSLPAFMNFDAVTKTLTVNPGIADIGSYTLDVSYTSDYDGMSASSKLKSHVVTIYRVEIGSGTITNQSC